MSTKQETRKYISCEKSKYTAEELKEMSRPIVDSLLCNDSYKTAKTILLYKSLQDEVYTHDLIEEASKTKKVYITPVTGDNYEFPGTELAIVPGLAFDKEGNRLGRGGGYYDRLLPKLGCRAIGLCFSFQILGNVPRESHDIKMDEVIYG